jgi:hypothetical protein
MDLFNSMKNNSINYVNGNTNNRLTKKLPNIKINFSQDEKDLERPHENNKIFYNENKTFSIEESKTKVIKMIILDEKNNILTKKYKLIVNLNKNIIKLPFNLDPYQINFVSLNDLSKQILNKLKTNDSSDINHYDNLCFSASVSFYDENLLKRLTDDDIFNYVNDGLICKLEIHKIENPQSSNKNKYSDLNVTDSKFKKNFNLEKHDSTDSNIKCFVTKNNSEIKLNQLSNINKNSPFKINREFKNRDIILNDFINEEKHSYLPKLKNLKREISNKKDKFIEDSHYKENLFTKDFNKNDHPYSRNKENQLNKSSSESYNLTNTSFYHKIKPKNVELLIRDSEKKSKNYNARKNKLSGETLDFQYIMDNSSKINKNTPHSFSFEKPNNNSFNNNAKSTDKIIRNTQKSDNNFSIKNDKKEKNPSHNFKTNSTISFLYGETVDDNDESKNTKLPAIISKSSKYQEMKKAGIFEKTLNKPIFINLFDNKKEAKSLFRISLLTKNFKLANEKTQISFKEPLKLSDKFDENSNAEGFRPNINHNNSKSVIFNSLYKSFQDDKLNENIFRKSSNFNKRLSLPEIDYEIKFMKNSVKSNNHIRNLINEGRKRSRSFRKGKIFPAKLLIKKNHKLEDGEINYNSLDLKTSYQFLSSNSHLKIRTLKKSNSPKNPKENNVLKSIRISKSIESISKRNKKPNKQMQSTKQIQILKNILDIENKENLYTKSHLSISPDKDRIHIDEINENFDSEILLTYMSSNKKLSNNFAVNNFAEKPNHKIILSKVNNKINFNIKEDDCGSKKSQKKIVTVINQTTQYNNQNTRNGNNFYNLSISESKKNIDKSIISDHEGELKRRNKLEVCSETERDVLINGHEKNLSGNRTRKLINAFNNVKNSKKLNILDPNNSRNILNSVDFKVKENHNYNNYYLNLFEETQKIKFKIENFIKNDLTKLINNELLEDKFKGIVFFERSEFDYQTKREFLFYAFISCKFDERINFKKNSHNNFSLPVPGGEHKIIHTGISTISIKIIKNESEINYEIFRKCKNNYFKLIQEYNQVLKDIIHKVRENISEILRFFSNLNCLKINKLYIDFHFMLLYMLKNENIFLDRKIVFKLLEFITKDNNYVINYKIFYELRRFSLENINNQTKEKCLIHIDFIRLFLKFYLGDEKQKHNIIRILDELKYSLGISDFDLTVFISDDLSDLIKNAEINNIRDKVANIYLTLIKLLE